MASHHIGLFVTLSAYGNRLHGDERGTVDRSHNVPGEPLLARNDARAGFEATRMSFPPVRFRAPIRAAVEAAIQEACAFRGWKLSACHCRTTHLHAVVGTDADRHEVMMRLKDRSTRSLRQTGFIGPNQPLWARGGSGRYLWTEADVAAACGYTIEGQGDAIPGTTIWDAIHDQDP